MSITAPRLGKKASAIAAAQQHTNVVADQIATPIKRDEFAFCEWLPTESIRPDSEQSRKLGVTLELLRNPESVSDPELRAEVDKLLGLAINLKAIGQRYPIEVYRDGGVYRLLSGERRWWAAQVAEIEKLYAKVLPEKPKDLRLKQLSENIQRSDLSPPEMLLGLQSMLEEAAKIDEPITTALELRARIGMPLTSARRWWSILEAPKDVIDALNAGRIGVVAADAASRIASEEERAAFMAAAEQGGTSEALNVRTKAKAATPPPKRQAGRPRTIPLGTIKRHDVARLLLTRVLGSEPQDVDWNDPKAIAKAIQGMLKRLEADLG